MTQLLEANGERKAAIAIRNSTGIALPLGTDEERYAVGLDFRRIGTRCFRNRVRNSDIWQDVANFLDRYSIDAARFAKHANLENVALKAAALHHLSAVAFKVQGVTNVRRRGGGSVLRGGWTAPVPKYRCLGPGPGYWQSSTQNDS